MFTSNCSTLWHSCLLLLSLSVTLAVTGCSNMPSADTADSPIIHTTTTNNQAVSDKTSTKCPPYNPEQTMCTAQYDPVCVKIKNRTGVSYRTAGNACSACGTTSAINYVRGQCS